MPSPLQIEVPDAAPRPDTPQDADGGTRHAHRGAYEHLWAEHRYSIVGLSIKHSRTAAGKLGRTPHVLSFLGFLARHRNERRRGLNHALLSVYDHLQPHLERLEREKLVEAVLSGDSNIDRMLYDLVCSTQKTGLYGCRLFFPPRALNKFWDYGEQPGLQVLLGPRMVHIPFAVVRKRLESLSGIHGAGLHERLAALKAGISRDEYDTWPELFRMALEDHLLVAVLPTAVRLHPRVGLPFPEAAVEDVGPMHAALLALERLWDADPEMVPHLPPIEHWRAAMSPERLPWARPVEPDSIDIAIGMVSEEFADQLDLECGRKAGNEAVPDEGPTENREEAPESDEDDVPGLD